MNENPESVTQSIEDIGNDEELYRTLIQMQHNPNYYGGNPAADIGRVEEGRRGLLISFLCSVGFIVLLIVGAICTRFFMYAAVALVIISWISIAITEIISLVYMYKLSVLIGKTNGIVYILLSIFIPFAYFITAILLISAGGDFIDMNKANLR